MGLGEQKIQLLRIYIFYIIFFLNLCVDKRRELQLHIYTDHALMYSMFDNIFHILGMIYL